MTLNILLPALLLVLTSPVWASTPDRDRVRHPALFQRSDLEALDLSRRYPRQTQQLLGAGEKFLTFWQPASDTRPAGAIIILPSEGEHADWPDAIGPLRREMPRYGWSSMTVTMPDPQPASLPAAFRAWLPDVRAPMPEPEPVVPAELPEEESTRSDAPGPENETAPAEPEDNTAATDEPAEARPEIPPAAPAGPPSYSERIDARIEAALAFARVQHLGRLVLLGHGTGAYWAARHLARGKSAEIDQLIMLDVRQPEGESLELEDLLDSLKTPTVDAYYLRGEAPAQAGQRESASQRARLPHYTQVALPVLTAPADYIQKQLVRRVRSWLEQQP